VAGEDAHFIDTKHVDQPLLHVIFQQLTNYSAGAINGRIRGGAVNQTIYTMDGFNLFREFPTVKASAAYEIQTAGYGADNVMAPGGVVNLVSRSGSNRFELRVGIASNIQDHPRRGTTTRHQWCHDSMTIIRQCLAAAATEKF